MVVHPLGGSDVQHCWTGGRGNDEASSPAPEQIVLKLREGDRLLDQGKDIAEVLRHLELSESSLNRWRAQYDRMKADEAKRLR